ncbi:MAG: c-type cytochrome [Burkholderiaceae bacterium]|nr:c-type cytochrome [Burkholderiaceae bacterium]
MTPNFRFPLRGLLLAAGLGACLAAQAQSPAATPSLAERQVRTWAATCAACHGTEGRDQGAIPAIAGRGAETLYRALIEFKTGQRPAATVMHQHAKGYSDEELRRLADYFAALPVR